MGIDNNLLDFLAESTKSGASLAKTSTRGRQNFFRITEASLVAGPRRAGFSSFPPKRGRCFGHMECMRTINHGPDGSRWPIPRVFESA